MKKPILHLIIPAIVFGFSFMACQSQEQQEEEKTVMEREVPVHSGAPFIHTAYFWLKEGVTEAEKDAFIQDSKGLANIETVLAFYDGEPAPTNRDVVENTYDYAIVFHFADLEAQEFYQGAPLHKALIEKHEHLWEKVMVTDITP